MKKHYIGILALGLGLSSSAKESQSTYHEVGVASYYDDAFDGCITANGETFSQQQMTCAHLWLPLGTLVKVTNLKNHKWAVLRVNDRGPFIDGRMVDLSRDAAKALGFINDGLTTVRLETISSKRYVALCAEDFEAGIKAGFGRSNRLAIENVAVRKNGLINPDTLWASNLNASRYGKTKSTARLQMKDRNCYWIFIGIFYRPEKVSAFHEERKAYIPETEPLRFFEEHAALTWIAP